MIRYSFMESFYSKRAERYVPSPRVTQMSAESWEDFVVQLYQVQQTPFKSKDTAPLISPAFYNGEARRCNANVSGWSFLALDVDNDVLDFDEAVKWMESLGHSYLMYTTASSRAEHHKYRIFIPFTRDVEPAEMDRVWQGGFEYFGRITDPNCKDKSRGYYVPGQYPNAYTDFAAGFAGCIDPNELIKLAPPPAPEPEYTPFTDAGYSWNWNNIHDCPFVRNEWIQEYVTLPNGGDQHYQAVYKFMLRVAGRAKESQHRIPTGDVARLARELDLLKDQRWTKQKRSWEKEAKNAVEYVYSRGTTNNKSPLSGYRKQRG